MHPFQSEIHARTELDARWHDAAQHRLLHAATARAPHRWSHRAGHLLVALGDRLDRTGQRLQRAGRSPRSCVAPCLEG